MQSEYAWSREVVGLISTLFLSVHLIAMNVASAGPLVCIWLRKRAKLDGSVADELGGQLARLSLMALFLGALTGTVQLFFMVTPSYLAAIDRLSRQELWFAGLEMVFSVVCLLAYAGCWQKLADHPWWHALLALLSSSNLLYHFPPLMSVLAKLAEDASWAKEPILDRAALLPLMMRGEIVAMSVHFVLASLAVAAVAVLWLASKAPQEGSQVISRRAAWIALVVTVLQLPVGGWLVVSLPNSARMSMMGSSATTSLAFVGALLLTFVLMQRLLNVALGAVTPRELRNTCYVLAALVVLMAATLTGSRLSKRQMTDTASNKKQPQCILHYGC